MGYLKKLKIVSKALKNAVKETSSQVFLAIVLILSLGTKIKGKESNLSSLSFCLQESIYETVFQTEIFQ